MNFGALLKIKQAWDSLLAAHPKLPMFLNALNSKQIVEGTIITIQVQYPDGSNIKGGIKVLQSDLELFETVKQINPNE